MLVHARRVMALVMLVTGGGRGEGSQGAGGQLSEGQQAHERAHGSRHGGSAAQPAAAAEVVPGQLPHHSQRPGHGAQLPSISSSCCLPALRTSNGAAWRVCTVVSSSASYRSGLETESAGDEQSLYWRLIQVLWNIGSVRHGHQAHSGAGDADLPQEAG